MMNTKSLVVFFSLLFFVLCIALKWHVQPSMKIYVPTTFSVIYFTKFFFIMFLLNDRFFIKPRKKWTSLIFGAVAGVIVGSILWAETELLIEQTRSAFFNTLNKVGIKNMMIATILASAISSLHFLIGMLSALTSRFFIEKYHLLQGTQI